MAYSEIINNLYQGNQFSTKIAEVDAIVSIGCNSKNKQIPNFKVSVKDSNKADLTPYLDDATDFIDSYLKKNKKVLVHCQAGINRSTAIVLSYLVRYENMDLLEAQELIVSKRKVRFKEHFLDQIKEKYINFGD